MTLLSTLLQAKNGQRQVKGRDVQPPGGFTGPPQGGNTALPTIPTGGFTGGGFGGVPQRGLVRPPQIGLNNQKPAKGVAPQRPGGFSNPQPAKGNLPQRPGGFRNQSNRNVQRF